MFPRFLWAPFDPAFSFLSTPFHFVAGDAFLFLHGIEEMSALLIDIPFPLAFLNFFRSRFSLPGSGNPKYSRTCFLDSVNFSSFAFFFRNLPPFFSLRLFPGAVTNHFFRFIRRRAFSFALVMQALFLPFRCAVLVFAPLRFFSLPCDPVGSCLFFP